jgi:hypothetical protein
MRLIGYWIRDLKDEEFCAPQEVVGDMPQDVRTKVADYLDNAAVDHWHTQRGFSWCRFFCGIPFQRMGCSELTDGRWRWPQGLSHYVREHEIILPQEFVAHALANGRDEAVRPVAEDARLDTTKAALQRADADLAAARTQLQVFVVKQGELTREVSGLDATVEQLKKEKEALEKEIGRQEAQRHQAPVEGQK